MKPERSVTCFRPARRCAFTLVELLVVIAIMAILASLVVSAVSDASADTASVIARQQQAVVQGALNNWISGHSTTNSLTTTMGVYTGETTDEEKLGLIQDYLDDSSVANFSPGDGGSIATEAMAKNGERLTFSAWTNLNTYPKATLVPE